jgi:outer membrane protein
MNETNTDFVSEVKPDGEKSPKCKMNIQTIINIVLLVGLALAFVFIFTKTPESSSSKSANNEGSINIAYINSDTLMMNYDLFQDLKLVLEEETLKLRKDLEEREKSLQSQFMAYQKKAQSGNISYEDAQKTEERLGRLQQELIQLGEQYTNQIAMQEYEMTLRVYDSLHIAMDLINEIHSYDFILGYTQGAGILYAHPSHDITVPILEILNERYAIGKKEENNEKEK